MVQRTMTVDPGKSGPGMTRIEYVGPYAAPMSFVGKKSRTLYSFGNSEGSQFQWVADVDLDWFLSMSDFRKAREAFVAPAVALPVAVDVIAAALEAAKPIAAKTIEDVAETVPPKKHKGRPQGSKNRPKETPNE